MRKGPASPTGSYHAPHGDGDDGVVDEELTVDPAISLTTQENEKKVKQSAEAVPSVPTEQESPMPMTSESVQLVFSN